MSITLFQSITPKLTPDEKKTLVPMLVDCLAFTHEGHIYKGSWICGWFASSGHKVTGAKLRKLVNYIRIKKLKRGIDCDWGNKVVIGTSKGYFITSDPKIIMAQMESLQGRVDSQLAVVNSLKEELVNIKKHKV
jgi:hypothetical protein